LFRITAQSQVIFVLAVELSTCLEFLSKPGHICIGCRIVSLFRITAQSQVTFVLAVELSA